MKKIIFTLSLIIILVMTSVTAFADEIIVRIDSNAVEFNDKIGSPFIDENYRTQVPFRATLEKFGAAVDWNNETRTAVATKGDITVEVPIGESYILKNGEKIVVDTVAQIVDNRTYLPIRAVVEAFGSEVQWDQDLNTVVITTEPIDAKAVLMEANKNSYKWENLAAKILMEMKMPIPDETGNVQTMEMNIDMNMTAFMKPLKMKAAANMVADYQGQSISQPIMDMYYTLDDNKFTTYMGINDGTGILTWVKTSIENEAFADLMDYNKSEESLELYDKYIKDVKYFGNYTDEQNRTLKKMQYTLSGEIYEELLGSQLDELEENLTEEDLLALDMLKNFSDFKCIVYIDEATNEFVKYEMNLGEIISSMMSGMSDIMEMPQESLDILKGLEAKMIMEVLNVNEAEDFEIPQEALDAPDAAELQEETNLNNEN